MTTTGYSFRLFAVIFILLCSLSVSSKQKMHDVSGTLSLHKDMTKPVVIALPVSSTLTVKAVGLAGKGFKVGTWRNSANFSDVKPLPADGTVIFPNLDAGNYRIWVVNEGNKTSYGTHIKLKPGQNFTLDLDKKRSVKATIIFTKNGIPVPDFEMSISDKQSISYTGNYSDSKGECQIAFDKPGKALLSYGQTQGNLITLQGKRDIELKPGENTINIKLPTGKISGRVTNAMTGEPVPGALVQTYIYDIYPVQPSYNQPYSRSGVYPWFSGMIATANDGTFTLDTLQDGKYILVALTEQWQTIYISNHVNVSSKKPVTDLELRTTALGKLQVSLVDSKSGKALRAMPVVLFTPAGIQYFHDNSYEKPANLPAGKYVLWIRPDDGRHVQAKTQIEIKSGVTTKISVKLDTAGQRIVFRAPKGGKFEDLAWADKSATAFKGPADAPAVNDGTIHFRPWIAYKLSDARTGKSVLAGPNGPEWGGYLSGFNINRTAALPLKPGTYMLDAVMRNTENYSVSSNINLWRTRTKISVVAGKDTVIMVK